MTQWYYADRSGQQQGPVDAGWFTAALQRGEINATTLVWRDGLRDWVPLTQAATELGIALPAAPPPPMPAASAPRVVVAKPGGSSTWVIVAVVLIFGFVVVGGILAAIAIPAYHDYAVRAKISEGINQGRALRIVVADFHEREQRCPGNADEGFKAPAEYAGPFLESIEVGELESGHCAIRVAFHNLGRAELDDATLTFVMDADGEWTHDTDLPPRYLPASMRSGAP